MTITRYENPPLDFWPDDLTPFGFWLNHPIPFDGTAEEKAHNFGTHRFHTYRGETECDGCCAKPGHVAAFYPCGFEPPRELIWIERS